MTEWNKEAAARVLRDVVEPFIGREGHLDAFEVGLWLLDALPQDGATRLEQHMTACPPCAAEAAAMRAAYAAFPVDEWKSRRPAFEARVRGLLSQLGASPSGTAEQAPKSLTDEQPSPKGWAKPVEDLVRRGATALSLREFLPAPAALGGQDLRSASTGPLLRQVVEPLGAIVYVHATPEGVNIEVEALRGRAGEFSVALASADAILAEGVTRKGAVRLPVPQPLDPNNTFLVLTKRR